MKTFLRVQPNWKFRKVKEEGGAKPKTKLRKIMSTLLLVVSAILFATVSFAYAGHPACAQFKGKKRIFCECADGRLGMRSGRLVVLPLANRNAAPNEAHIACLKRHGFQ